jgi:hypothetical protein
MYPVLREKRFCCQWSWKNPYSISQIVSDSNNPGFHFQAILFQRPSQVDERHNNRGEQFEAGIRNSEAMFRRLYTVLPALSCFAIPHFKEEG